jgi:hypothetical protein
LNKVLLQQEQAPTELYAIAAGLVGFAIVGGIILYLALVPPPTAPPPPSPAPTPAPSPAPAPPPTLTTSSLTASITPSSPTVNDRITVKGTLLANNQPVQQAPIYIKLNGSFLANPTTDSTGSFSYVFGPEQAGSYTLDISYPGSNLYSPAETSITFSVSEVTAPPPAPAPSPAPPVSVSSITLQAGPKYVGLSRAYSGTLQLSATISPAAQGVNVAIYSYPSSNPGNLALVAILPTDSSGNVKTGFPLPAFNIKQPGSYSFYAIAQNVKSNVASVNVVSGFDVSSLDICSNRIAEGDYAYVANQHDTNQTGYFVISNYGDYRGFIGSSPSPCGSSVSSVIQTHPYQPWYTFVGSSPPANAAPPGTQP